MQECKVASKFVRISSPGRTIACSLLVLLNVACGSSKKSESDSGTAVGSGELFSWTTGDTLSISPKGITQGNQYIVLPFTTGDINTIGGAGSESFNFKVGKPTAKLSSRVHKSEAIGSSDSEKWQQIDHFRRSIHNRYEISRGLEQNQGVWSALRGLDKIEAENTEFNLEKPSEALMGQNETIFRMSLSVANSEEALRNAKNSAAAREVAVTCPTDDVLVPKWTDADTFGALSIEVAASHDEAEYCLVIAEDSTPVSESDIGAMKASIAEVMRRYKTVIYNDTFSANSKDGYTFKPLIVVEDFGNGDLWPSVDSKLIVDQKLLAVNRTYQVAGVFIADLTTALKRPVIYMASDLSKVETSKSLSAEVAKKTFHATLAHEMQHAVQDYYDKRGAAGSEQSLFIDEGIAHYMEDLFGYGEMTFEGFPKVFLTTLLDRSGPFLGSSEDSPTQRGAAQSLIYYLVSQKGGITFTDGNFVAGEGLKALATVVKNTNTKGAKGLSDAFSKNWSQTVGGFLGALIVDGTTVAGVPAIFSNQIPVDGIRDLQGGKTKRYGMRFNGFSGLVDRLNGYVSVGDTELTTEGRQLTSYQTVPMNWTAGKLGESLPLTFDAESGRHVQVIRIK